jgi:hypothetical protein
MTSSTTTHTANTPPDRQQPPLLPALEPVSKDCETHGPYTATGVRFGQREIWKQCPSCASERAEEERLQRERTANTPPVPSSGPLHDFIASCIAASGLCVLHRPYTETVAPHALSGAGASFDPVVWPGATRWLVSAEGISDMVLVLARSDRDLEQRVEWILAAKVISFERAPEPGAADRMKAALQERSEERRQAKLRKLRETAACELPTEGTPRWREIVDARKELAALEAERARPGEMFPQADPPTAGGADSAG